MIMAVGLADELRAIALRDRIVTDARKWIGTPFIHQGAVCGPHGGADCLQLVIEVGKSSGVLPTDFVPPATYPRGWFLRDSRYLEMLLPYLQPIDTTPLPGDVALFRMDDAPKRAPAHSTIVTEWPRVIHADPERGVVETDSTIGVIGHFVVALRPRALLGAA